MIWQIGVFLLIGTIIYLILTKFSYLNFTNIYRLILTGFLILVIFIGNQFDWLKICLIMLIIFLLVGSFRFKNM